MIRIRSAYVLIALAALLSACGTTKFEIEDASNVVVVAVRHQLEDDYY